MKKILIFIFPHDNCPLIPRRHHKREKRKEIDECFKKQIMHRKTPIYGQMKKMPCPHTINPWWHSDVLVHSGP